MAMPIEKLCVGTWIKRKYMHEDDEGNNVYNSWYAGKISSIKEQTKAKLIAVVIYEDEQVVEELLLKQERGQTWQVMNQKTKEENTKKRHEDEDTEDTDEMEEYNHNHTTRKIVYVLTTLQGKTEFLGSHVVNESSPN